MKRDKRGFTLAELLVVVAIIAVLVAIAIPIFTNQLEKSREATDAANIRSQYAQVMTDAITEGGDVNGKTKYGAIELKQKKDNWQDETLGNNLHSLFENHIVGEYPKTGGAAWVEYDASNGYAILHYEGEGSSNGGSSSGGSTGGNGGSSGGTGSTNKTINDLINTAKDFDSNGFSSKLGNIYNYNNQYYVCIFPKDIQPNTTPTDGQYSGAFISISSNSRVLSEKDIQVDEWGNNPHLSDLVEGDIYQDGDTFYILRNPSSYYLTPNNDNIRSESNIYSGALWVKIN